MKQREHQNTLDTAAAARDVEKVFWASSKPASINGESASYERIQLAKEGIFGVFQQSLSVSTRRGSNGVAHQTDSSVTAG